MRAIDINGQGPIFDKVRDYVILPNSGFAPISEADMLANLAEALRRQERLAEAISNMRRMLRELDEDGAAIGFSLSGGGVW